MRETDKKPPLTIEAVRSKDPDVFQTVYERVMPIMERTAGRIVPADDVPDVAHDAYLKVLKQAEKGALHAESLEGYFAVAARNKALDMVRRDTFRRERLGGKPVVYDEVIEKDAQNIYSPPEETPESVELEVALFRRVQEVIGHEGQSTAVYLDYKGFSYEEIGDTLGVEIGTVRSRIHRGKEKIKKNAEFVFGEDVTDIPERIAYKEQKRQQRKDL